MNRRLRQMAQSDGPYPPREKPQEQEPKERAPLLEHPPLFVPPPENSGNTQLDIQNVNVMDEERGDKFTRGPGHDFDHRIRRPPEEINFEPPPPLPDFQQQESPASNYNAPRPVDYDRPRSAEFDGQQPFEGSRANFNYDGPLPPRGMHREPLVEDRFLRRDRFTNEGMHVMDEEYNRMPRNGPPPPRPEFYPPREFRGPPMMMRGPRPMMRQPMFHPRGPPHMGHMRGPRPGNIAKNCRYVRI